MLAWAVVAPLFFAGAPHAEAQDVVLPPLPTAVDQVDVFLLTIARGDNIEALFGHTILRVIDRTTNTDLNFNWGIFDFTGPGFVWNFYRGDLNYALAVSDFGSLVGYYSNVEARGIIQNRIVLTAQQKRLLLARLWDNARPENVHYQYSQLFDNCATRPRDHLDAALGGRIKRYFSTKPAPGDFRSYVMTDAAPSWWVHLGLDMVTTSIMDRPISLWEAMFLPANLRDELLLMPALDDNGRPVTGHTLLEDSTYVLSLPEPRPAANPYFLAGLGFVGVLGTLALGMQNRTRERGAARYLAFASIVFGLWSGVWGTVCLGNWLVSHYLETKHNALLWLMWPTDWLFVAYGVRLLWRQARPLRLVWWSRAVRFCASLHLLALLVAGLLSASGALLQPLLPALASTGLAGLFYYTTLIRYGSAREL